jgi:HEAT repeats
MLRPRLVTIVAVLLAVATAPVLSQRGSRKPLSPADIDAVTDLVRLEDTRQFDEATLGRLVKSTHPEVRRRAVIAVGRIVNPAGAALLRPLQSDPDPEIVATVAFAYGQLKDAESVPWLSFLITSKQVSAAREAARSLGKIRSPEARTALARYLTDAPVAASASPVVGEALLSLGRFTTRLGLTRGNLSWASAGLDTGRPGYTLGSTPQPHNEGNFTPLGRVVRGMDVVDRLELGDAITGAKLIK